MTFRKYLCIKGFEKETFTYLRIYIYIYIYIYTKDGSNGSVSPWKYLNRSFLPSLRYLWKPGHRRRDAYSSSTHAHSRTCAAKVRGLICERNPRINKNVPFFLNQLRQQSACPRLGCAVTVCSRKRRAPFHWLREPNLNNRIKVET